MLYARYLLTKRESEKNIVNWGAWRESHFGFRQISVVALKIYEDTPIM